MIGGCALVSWAALYAPRGPGSGPATPSGLQKTLTSTPPLSARRTLPGAGRSAEMSPELTVFRTRSLLACLCPAGVVGCVYLLSDSSTVWLSRRSLPSVQASHLRQGASPP